MAGRAAGCLAAFLFLAALVSRCSCQLLFLMEPPPRLSFSNSSGARVSCAAHGNPPPLITWLTEDGSPVTEITALRGALPNGTLWLGSFSAVQYRSDIHAAVYRCRAANSVGTVLSRDMRVDAVMDMEWDVTVQGAHVLAGGAALLTCVVPAAVRAHVSITRWFKDGAVLSAGPSDSGGRWAVTGGRGNMLLVRELRTGRDESSAYSCEAQHALTGEKRRSPPAGITVTETSNSMPARMLPAPAEEVVMQGADIRLVCCAVGQPPPTYSWFYQSDSGDTRPVAVTSGIRVSMLEQVVAIRRAQPSDAGTWTCRADNRHGGEQRHRIRLTVLSRLSVHLHPQLQIANSGSMVIFNCSVGGTEGGDTGVRVRWLHDGVPVGGAERVLRVHGVARAHRGMYQCVAERDGDNAQAAAELRLGDTAPELHYTFIEQALHPGPALALHCAASGSPPPRFTWLIDNQLIEEHNTPQRSVTQYMSVNGDVVSYMNLSSVRPEDGGRYSCRAHNSRGAVEHSARLNVYGPPSIRSVGPIRVVAGSNATVYCPYSGFPISEIRWQRGGTDVTSGGGGVEGGGAGRAAAGVAGELLLWPAETSDAGLYSCRVTAPAGQYAQKDLQILVKNPPKIAPFMFPTDLVEGSSAQILCGLNAGDKPIYFSWLKDGQPLSPILQVQEKSLDEFSLLMFSGVTSMHSGDYTCIASNAAAEVNHTARLTVKVAPSWLFEPQDVSALLGTPILVNCATKGYPEPKITWLKGQGTTIGDFRPVSSMELQYSVLANGSLSIAPAARRHEGQYLCRADNGVGRGLAKIIRVSVNEPAHFEYSSRNMTSKRTAAVSLQCDALGDPPIQIQWTHDLKRVDLTTYRVSVSEVRTDNGARSQLNIAHAERRDSGVYRCRAENAYGRDELLIYLAVQEYPEAPRGVSVSWRDARGARLSWRLGYDGNARVRTYRLQYRVVGEPRLQQQDRGDWHNAPTRDLPADHVIERPAEVSEGTDEAKLMEYRLDGLRPATAYALRLAAVNAIGESEYSDPVIVKTLEEAPSEPPHTVQVQATAPGELLVKWKAPPQESWNGELLGYVVSWREAGAGENTSRSLPAAGWGASEVVLPGLRTHAHYDVRVRAFNAVGAGPASPPLTATTLEGVPEAPPQRVRCEPLSAQSIRMWWEPPPPELRGGILLGYEVQYEVIGGEAPSNPTGSAVSWGSRAADVRRVGGLETVLHGLQRAANYSLAVRARTAAGSGSASPSVFCATHEDVPGPPADAKAVASSEESVLVSWLPPAQKNGKIKHYTVYSRPAGRIGQHSHHNIPHQDDENEYSSEVRGLQEHQLYEFWVTAATASGEGELSPIIARKPNSRAGARVASFGRRVWIPGGTRTRLRCVAAGRPQPLRVWTHSRPGPPIAADPRYLIDDRGDLLILSVDRGVTDNYTCSVRNPWGDDSATWEVRAIFPPARSELRLSGATAARLHLAWDSPADGGSPIHSYSVHYARVTPGSSEPVWVSTRVAGDVRTHTLERLACGAEYRVKVVAHNAVGAGPDSNQLLVSTKGGPSKAAPEKELISSNSTCVRLNLLTWESNGCPVAEFSVAVRAFDEDSWREMTASTSAEPLALCGLKTAAWYHLRVVARSAASSTRANYYFSTLTQHGERIPPPAVFPPAEGGSAGGGAAAAVGAAAALALVSALMLLAIFAWRRRQPYSCFRKGYVQGDISEDEDNKSVEKRDNHRNCQQVYTSSPIKHPLGKKEQQEMYEISPYATFSMSGATGGGAGAGAESEAGAGAGAGSTVQFRTFGRAEEAALAAPPARPHLDHTHKHRSFNKPDEYTLSRAMTLMVSRREDSDTDSSGSPCTECNSNASYRLPVGGGKGEVFRPITDSSAESQLETCSLSARAHDKSRRRARRHHTPTSTRYQQRQEQERRDFTIHV